jgi:hypothetical protein
VEEDLVDDEACDLEGEECQLFGVSGSAVDDGFFTHVEGTTTDKQPQVQPKMSQLNHLLWISVLIHL